MLQNAKLRALYNWAIHEHQGVIPGDAVLWDYSDALRLRGAMSGDHFSSLSTQPTSVPLSMHHPSTDRPCTVNARLVT